MSASLLHKFRTKFREYRTAGFKVEMEKYTDISYMAFLCRKVIFHPRNKRNTIYIRISNLKLLSSYSINSNN
jgi:hypothetical protein